MQSALHLATQYNIHTSTLLLSTHHCTVVIYFMAQTIIALNLYMIFGPKTTKQIVALPVGKGLIVSLILTQPRNQEI